MKMNASTDFAKNGRPHILMITNHGIHDWDVRSGLRDTGGQNHYVNALSETLVELGFCVTTMNRGGFPDPLTNEMRRGIHHKGPYQRIVYLEGGGDKFIRKEDLDRSILGEEANFAARLLKEEGLSIELVISHYWDAAVLANMLREKLGFKAKHLWIPHSIGAMKRENFRGQPTEVTGPLKFSERIAFEKEAMKGIDAVISTSGELSKYLRRDYSREPELFLPPCIDTDLIRPLPPGAGCERILDFLSGGDASLRSRLAGSRSVLEVSRTDRTKRKDVVIRAIAQAAKKHPDLMGLLTISPDAKEVYADLCSLMEEQGVRDRMVFIGMVPREIMSELFALSTVYVTPADQETFGMSIQEAAACRRPIISSDRVPFATEYLLEGERRESIETSFGPAELRWGAGGVVAPSGNHEAFGHALEKLLSDKSLQEKLADGAYRATIPYFTWPNLTRELLQKAQVQIPADKA